MANPNAQWPNPINDCANLLPRAAKYATDRLDIAVISLEGAQERRHATSNMLAGSGLEWSYFDAHTRCACEELCHDQQRARLHFGRDLTLQEIAVFSSHYAVWKQFIARGKSDYLLVMEDDLILDINFPLTQFVAFCANAGMDYVRLFGKHYAQAVRLGFFHDRSLLRYRSSPAGTQAYLLSVSGAKQLLHHCRNVDATIDLAMDRFWETGLPLYSLFPYPVIERFIPTSIPMANEAESVLSRLEKFRWDLHRASRKFMKRRADMKLRTMDASLRAKMPAFQQIGIQQIDTQQVSQEIGATA